MKKTLIILVLLPMLVSFDCYGDLSDKTVCVDTDAQIGNGIIYLQYETEPFTGKDICKYKNGQKKSETNFKDGKRDGMWTSWNKKGQLSLETNYKNGKKDGKFTRWYENGQIETKTNYKDGKRDGKWTAWFESGQIKAEGNAKDDKQDGKWTLWYENGQIEEEATYKDGKCISGDC